MNYREFLDRLVNHSRESAADFYASSDKYCLEGAFAGIEACRDKSPPELSDLLERARKVRRSAFHKTSVMSRYWRVTSFLFEVEWICDVVSFVLLNEEMEPIIRPTIRAAKTAKYIIDQAQQELQAN